MSVVDSAGVNDPSAATSTTSQEYSPVFYSITILAMKAGASHGLQNNTGLLYVVRKGGSRDDTGTILAALTPGSMYTILITPGALRGFSPYRYYLDADSANDAGQCTGFLA